MVELITFVFYVVLCITFDGQDFSWYHAFTFTLLGIVSSAAKGLIR